MISRNVCGCHPFSTATKATAATKNTKQKLSAIYGAGLSASGALAIPALVVTTKKTPPKEVKSPHRISGLNFCEITHVASGFGFSLFSSHKKLFGSGLNNYSQISAIQQKNDGQEYYISRKSVSLPTTSAIADLAAGRAHSLVACNDAVFAFGHNAYGQCGIDPNRAETVGKNLTVSPLLLPEEAQTSKVHCSLDTSFILTTEGKLFAFGLNEDGQCANGEFGVQPMPLPIIGDASTEKLIDVAGSTDTILAVSNKGDLFVWGQNEHNQAGPSNPTLQLNVSTRLPFSKRILSVASTACSCIALDSHGIVYTWGTQFLGHGPKITRLSYPTPLDQPLFNNKKVIKVFAGNTCAGALNEDGEFFIWGLNRFGQLGIDTDQDQLFPLQVYLPNDVVDISLGTDHSLFITK